MPVTGHPCQPGLSWVAHANIPAMTRLFISSLIGLLLLSGPVSGSGQVTRALLTVDGLNIPADYSVSAFRINTWGVVLLNVCSIPPSWNLIEEKYEDPKGLLLGRSDVHGAPLRELKQMYLVDVYGYQALPKGDPKGEFHPASFSGWIEVAKESWNMHGKRRALHASNFRLTPASQCPVPPPAAP